MHKVTVISTAEISSEVLKALIDKQLVVKTNSGKDFVIDLSSLGTTTSLLTTPLPSNSTPTDPHDAFILHSLSTTFPHYSKALLHTKH